MSSFSLLSLQASSLLAEEKYDEALGICERILEQLQVSLRAHLLKAKCLWELGRGTEYESWLQETKLKFPGCSPHIKEFEARLQKPDYKPKRIEFGKLFKTFRGWEEIDAELRQIWSEPPPPPSPSAGKLEKVQDEVGAGDLLVVNSSGDSPPTI